MHPSTMYYSTDKGDAFKAVCFNETEPELVVK